MSIDRSQGFDAYARGRREAGSKLVLRVREKAQRMERELGPGRLEANAADADVLGATMRWKSRQYRRTGMLDTFAIEWNVRLLERSILGFWGGRTAAAAD